MPFLDTIFGRNKPTSETASTALARAETELSAAPARIAAAEAALVNLADMSDEEHAAAIAERDAAHRFATRLEAQVQQLQGALADAERSEEAAELAARTKAASGMLAAYGGLLDQHDAQAMTLADTLAKMAEVEREIAACNAAIDAARRAGLKVPEKVETPDARYRAEPDVTTPERKVVEDKVVFTETSISYGPDGEKRHIHRDVPVGTTVKKGGRLVLRAGERLAKIKRTIPASTKYGRRCCSPTSETILAPARVGTPKYWPRDR